MNIIAFDFDGTLYHTSEPSGGKDLFKLKTGMEWPHLGWWSKPETLDLEIFPTPINEYVFREYEKWSKMDDSYCILATGRMEKMRLDVERILNRDDLTFNEVHLNPGMETFLFKTRLFEKLISKFNPDKFIMYDDRQEHIHKFKVWAETQPCEIHIIDVVNKILKINR